MPRWKSITKISRQFRKQKLENLYETVNRFGEPRVFRSIFFEVKGRGLWTVMCREFRNNPNILAHWRLCSYAFVRCLIRFIYDVLLAFLRETRLFHSSGRFLRNHQIILFSPVFSSSSFQIFFFMEHSHIRAIVRVCEMCFFFFIFIYLLWLASQRVFFAYYVIQSKHS